jgi:hypothetical protein
MMWSLWDHLPVSESNPVPVAPIPPIPANPAPIDFRTFLMERPPGARSEDVQNTVSIKIVQRYETTTSVAYVYKPGLELPCEECDGLRTFDCRSTQQFEGPEDWQQFSLLYRCRNCNSYEKHYVVFLRYDSSQAGTPLAHGYKLAEWPSFGEKVPRKALKLLDTDKDLFLRGRSAENRGLGIGAYAYYRRVLDQQKGRIIRAILNAAKRLGAAAEVIANLEWAENAWQFESAVGKLKGTLPEEECMERASAIRVVLLELAERVDKALEEHKEVNEAVSRLMKLTAERPPGDPEAAR